MLQLQGIECFFPNTLLDQVLTPSWEALLSRIGDVLMMHVLLERVILIRLPNQCFQQISGLPLPDLLRQQRMQPLPLLRKRPRSRKYNSRAGPAKRPCRSGSVTGVHEIIPRWRIFYSEHFSRRCHGIPAVSSVLLVNVA